MSFSERIASPHCMYSVYQDYYWFLKVRMAIRGLREKQANGLFLDSKF